MDAHDSTPLHLLVKSEQVSRRFWPKVDVGRSSACWEWRAYTSRFGYGKIRVGDKHVAAHRVAWMLEHGEIPSGMCVCHRCDNPACCNPDHMFLGTIQDNIADMDAKGRRCDLRGEDHWASSLTQSDVDEIRLLCHSGDVSQDEIAEMFGISKAQVSRIKLGRRWSDNPLGTPRSRPLLAAMDVRQIRRMLRDGKATPTELAVRYGVNVSCITRIRDGKRRLGAGGPILVNGEWQEVTR